MLDFDNITLPDGIDPTSLDAIEWVISKLPSEFLLASYFYQHSASAGILKTDGSPLKNGLNVHLFFWLDRRIPGKVLSAYLTKHCIETDFYQIGDNRGGVVQLVTGVDPAPIRSSAQPHFIAPPSIDDGVQCRLDSRQRQGLVRKSQVSVCIPEIIADIEDQARRLRTTTVDGYKLQHGYQTRVMLTNTAGKVAVTRYSVAAQNSTRPPPTGRTFLEGRLRDEDFLTLYFDDEGSPGSWYVCKGRPQIAYRYGDAAALPLKELSLGAHEYVRDVLRWFSEVPHRPMELLDGYLPTLSDFATAKISLILSPTGSGKTTAAINWIRSRIELGQLVLYAAPTIALVKQMRDELTNAGLSPGYYEDVWEMSFPHNGVIVTTIDSLPRLLKGAYANNVAHSLIFDEIHQGLDRFMGSNRGLSDFESALSKSRQSLLLTGTLTDVQRHALVEVARQALGILTENDYCCYEFPAVKSNPLEVRPTDFFDTDLASLLQEFRTRLSEGEPLPRFVMLLDTSKMEMYRLLIEQYGLVEYAFIVSRQEDTEEDIELARTSTRPILISSPLFGLGLNFAREPDILWARFDHVAADTNQIIQSVNRANRGERQCHVRIYGNVRPNAEFLIPETVWLRNEVRELLKGEATFAGLLEEHLHLDRVTYNELRKVERESLTALSTLVKRDAIQNFSVVGPDEPPTINKDKAGIVKRARSDAKAYYKQAIVDAAEARPGTGTLVAMVRLEQLNAELKNNWHADERRTERELEEETVAILMNGFGIKDPTAAKKIRPVKVRRLFGETSPWLSNQYSRDKYPEWAKVEAEKTDKLVVLLEKLEALKNGQLDVDDLSASLTRNGQLGDAFLALVQSDDEFQSINRKIDRLKAERKRVRRKGSKKDREAVRELGLDLLKDLLEPLGVTYGKKTSRGRQMTDNTQPIVPATWNLNEMILMLQRQSARLRALPSSQKTPVVSMPKLIWPGERVIPRRICEGCVFFHQNACSRGRPMEWQSSGSFDPTLQCNDFKAIKLELRLE